MWLGLHNNWPEALALRRQLIVLHTTWHKMHKIRIESQHLMAHFIYYGLLTLINWSCKAAYLKLRSAEVAIMAQSITMMMRIELTTLCSRNCIKNDDDQHQALANIQYQTHALKWSGTKSFRAFEKGRYWTPKLRKIGYPLNVYFTNRIYALKSLNWVATFKLFFAKTKRLLAL